jgi:hypothetical protein
MTERVASNLDVKRDSNIKEAVIYSLRITAQEGIATI